MAVLPHVDGTALYSIGDAYEKLIELPNSKLLKFVGITVNSSLTTVISWMAALKKGRAPRFDTTLIAVLEKIQDAMARFCVRDDHSTKTKVYGEKALALGLYGFNKD